MGSTPIEFRILRFLAARPYRAYTRRRIAKAVSTRRHPVPPEALDSHVARLRHAWPKVQIIFRGDSGFCRWKLLRWCEKHDVRYVVGLARNQVLERLAASFTQIAQAAFEETGVKQRHFHEIRYAAKANTVRHPGRIRHSDCP